MCVGMVPCFWKSCRQTIISFSTAESELIAECDAFIAQLGIGELMHELTRIRPVRILGVDNAAAVAITNGTQGQTPWRTRHLRVRSAGLVEAVQNGDIEILHVPGIYQVADIATKTLPVVVLKRLMLLLMLQSMAVVIEASPVTKTESVQTKYVRTPVPDWPIHRTVWPGERGFWLQTFSIMIIAVGLYVILEKTCSIIFRIVKFVVTVWFYLETAWYTIIQFQPEAEPGPRRLRGVTA